MKKLLTILLLLITIQLSATKYYIAPSTATPAGNDANAGTIAAPWLTWGKITGNVSAGDTIYIRGGTYTETVVNHYQCYWNGLTGTSSDTIKIWAYPGETPIWDMSGMADLSGSVTQVFGIEMNQCDYVWVRGLTIKNLPQQHYLYAFAIAWNLVNSSHNLIENCRVDSIGGNGFMIGHEAYGTAQANTEVSAYNTFKNCDAVKCEDAYTGYGNANGFGIVHNNMVANAWAPNTTYKNCRAWYCSDDGFDFYGSHSSGILIDGCWSFWSGMDRDFTRTGDGCGFKLGPTFANQATALITIQNSLAIGNYFIGFNPNCVDYENPVNVYNCLSIDNNVGYQFYWGPESGTRAIVRNNIAYLNDADIWDDEYNTIDHNSWDSSPSVTVSAADFVSIDTTLLDGARAANGSLPTTFGHLAVGSDLIGIGIGVGVNLDCDGNQWGYPDPGDAPSLGAYEYDPSPPDPPGLPEITTGSVTLITSISASVASNITSDGGGTISARGICWSTSANPTTSDRKTQYTGGEGESYVDKILPGMLQSNTVYHVRAYVTNESGTSYGSDVSFTTLERSVPLSGGNVLMNNGNVVIIN
jgi:hypothetical protein